MNQTFDKENERLRMLGDHLRGGMTVVTDNAFDIANLQRFFVKKLRVETVVGKHGRFLMLVHPPGEDDE